MAEVVNAELHLEAVDGLALGDAHHAGVVDEQVDRLVRGEDLFGGGLRTESSEPRSSSTIGSEASGTASPMIRSIASAARSWLRAAITTLAPGRGQGACGLEARGRRWHR